MKEDYLWDKTGEDAEIEKLENSLKMFRFQETAPPILPLKVEIFKEKSAGKFFSLFQTRFAFASAIGLAFILLLAVGVWFQLTETNPNNVAAIELPTPQKTNVSDSQPVNLPIPSPTRLKQKFALPKITANRPPIKFRKFIPSIVRPNLLTAQVKKKVNPAEVLTKEELYAYNQLMTALAITSSNLKLVKDKAQGIEN